MKKVRWVSAAAGTALVAATFALPGAGVAYATPPPCQNNCHTPPPCTSDCHTPPPCQNNCTLSSTLPNPLGATLTTVTMPSGSLPTTGADLLLLGVAALGTVGVGAGTVALARRRRNGEVS